MSEVLAVPMYLCTSLYGANGSVMALSMLPDNKQTATFNKMGNGYFYYADFLELGTSVGLSEKFIAKSIDTLVSKMNKMEDLVQQSFLNDTRKQLFVDLMNNRKARLIE